VLVSAVLGLIVHQAAKHIVTALQLRLLLACCCYHCSCYCQFQRVLLLLLLLLAVTATDTLYIQKLLSKLMLTLHKQGLREKGVDRVTELGNLIGGGLKEFVEGKAKAAKDKETAELGDQSTDEEKAAKKKKFSAERQVLYFETLTQSALETLTQSVLFYMLYRFNQDFVVLHVLHRVKI
jgi:hypothetical protein